MRLAEAELLAQERHRTSQVLTAPTDGRVISTLRPPQTFVRRGDELALFERDEQRTIQAFLTQEEVLQIGLGDKAIIYLPSRDQRASAVVTHIDRTMGFVDEMDSQFIWRGPRDRSARVTLEFVGISEDALRRRYQPGLPAVVIFERRSTSEIQSRMVDKVVVPIKVRPKTGDATTQKSKP